MSGPVAPGQFVKHFDFTLLNLAALKHGDSKSTKESRMFWLHARRSACLRLGFMQLLQSAPCIPEPKMLSGLSIIPTTLLEILDFQLSFLRFYHFTTQGCLSNNHFFFVLIFIASATVKLSFLPW
jgi:hypothetical protein